MALTDFYELDIHVLVSFKYLFSFAVSLRKWLAYVLEEVMEKWSISDKKNLGYFPPLWSD